LYGFIGISEYMLLKKVDCWDATIMMACSPVIIKCEVSHWVVGFTSNASISETIKAPF
jgi:hypothetical protein